MTLCQHFQDPAEHCTCQQGVTYSALAGGPVFGQVFRLPCIPITNRQGNEARHCPKYQPQEQDHEQHR